MRVPPAFAFHIPPHDETIGFFAADAVLHQHGYVFLFGFVKYTPLPTGAPPQSDDSPCGQEAFCRSVIGAAGQRACLSGGCWCQFALAIYLEAGVAQVNCFDVHAALRADVPAAHSLLCDRARHERSGVLLA